jgi:hypothetical protein
VELRRALQENSTVREPLLNARYEKQEVLIFLSPCAALSSLRWCFEWHVSTHLMRVALAFCDLAV